MLLIIGAVVGVIYSVMGTGRIEQSELMAAFTAVFGGVGLLFCRDIGVSTERENGHQELEDVGERTDANI